MKRTLKLLAVGILGLGMTASTALAGERPNIQSRPATSRPANRPAAPRPAAARPASARPAAPQAARPVAARPAAAAGQHVYPSADLETLTLTFDPK